MRGCTALLTTIMSTLQLLVAPLHSAADAPHHARPCVCSVGNGLGAGSPAAAKRSALAAGIIVPPVWTILASILTVPASQQAIISFFTNTSDVVLIAHIRHLLRLLALMLLFDMGQAGERCMSLLVRFSLCCACHGWLTGITLVLSPQ